MVQWVSALLDSKICLQINGITGFILFGLFLFYFFSKEGKDERGRGLVAIASFVSYISLFVLLNVFTMRLSFFMDNPVRMMNMLQCVYTLFLLTADITLLILRKVR